MKKKVINNKSCENEIKKQIRKIKLKIDYFFTYFIIYIFAMTILAHLINNSFF